MNYRHIYHAGNFADAFKHCILIALIEALQKKDKPILYLDTHAGIGRYDLTSKIAQKTREYESGVAKIMQVKNPEIAALATYQKIVATTGFPEFYPGSPIIVHELLRPQDHMILTELHREDVETLKQEFFGIKQVAVHHMDGYQGLKAFLPPKSGRGLILIDPPFEEKNEFQQIITALKIALDRFATGVYVIWYPIKDVYAPGEFKAALRELPCKNVITAKLTVTKNSNVSGLTACGIAIINAPWQFDAKLKSIVFQLEKIFAVDMIKAI